MMRGLRIAGAILWMVMAILALWPRAGIAMSNVRRQIAAEYLRLSESSAVDTGDPLRALVTAYAAAGIDMRGISRASDLANPDVASSLDLRAPAPSGPAPGDLAIWRSGSRGSPCVGVFISNGQLVTVDPDRHVFVRLSPAQLDSGVTPVASTSPSPSEPPQAQAGTLRAVRLNPQRWPGGDDTTVAPGRVALTHPDETADQLQWSYNHPHDADKGWVHQVATRAVNVAVEVSRSLGDVLDAGGAAVSWILRRSGPQGLMLLAFLGLLGTTFDGRGAHRALTSVTYAVLSIPTAFLTMVGAAGEALGFGPIRRITDLAIRRASSPLWGVASFLVSVVTGIDDSDHVTIGSVLIAVLSLPCEWLRSTRLVQGLADIVRADARLAAWGTRVPTWLRPALRSGVEASSAARRVLIGGRFAPVRLAGVAEDVVQLRPRALANVLGPLARRLPWAVRVGSPTARAAVWRAADVASLAWRRASFLGDLVEHAGDAARGLRRGISSGRAPVWSWLRRSVAGLPRGQREFVRTASRALSTYAFGPLIALVHAVHRHAGARALTSLLGGHPTETLSVSPPPAPRSVPHPLPADAPPARGRSRSPWPRFPDGPLRG